MRAVHPRTPVAVGVQPKSMVLYPTVSKASPPPLRQYPPALIPSSPQKSLRVLGTLVAPRAWPQDRHALNLAPRLSNSRMIGNAGLSRTLLVSGLNDSPRTTIRTSASFGQCFSNNWTTLFGCSSFTRITASNRGMDCPAHCPCAIKAFTSFGRQLPPKPQPAFRNDAIGGNLSLFRPRKYWLRCTPRITSTISIPPRAEPRLASSFVKEIRFASNALDAYLINSAVRKFVWIRGASENGLYTSSNTSIVRVSIPPSTTRSET